MNSKSISRLQKELSEIQSNIPEGFSDIISKEVITKWEASMKGPPNTPYESGTFKLSITFPEEYPFRPPSVNFQTPIFHPNIAIAGHVCLNILDPDGWTPVLTVSNILTSIRNLLTIPNADHPLNTEAAALLHDDKAKYEEKARQMTEQFAKSNKR